MPRFRTPLAAVLGVATATTLAVGALAVLTSGAADAGHHRPPVAAKAQPAFGALPVLSSHGFADPTVARWNGGFIGVATGDQVRRAYAPELGGPWTDLGPALTTKPAWALNVNIWAPDLEQVNGLWVMYFAAPVAGLPDKGRCIGVATAQSPDQPFVPDPRPLVCPASTPGGSAYDSFKNAPGLPFNGVIDPQTFLDKKTGRRYLLYRTQDVPSTIRMVRLPRDGRPGNKSRSSVELLRSPGVVENPEMVQRHGKYVMFTSEGNYGLCGYTTTWRRTKNLRDWSKSRPKVLLSYDNTGLCGPGGADRVVARGGEVLYFHGWTCPDLGNGNCPTGTNFAVDDKYQAHRSLFAMVIHWTAKSSPKVASFVTPVLPPPPPPTSPPTSAPPTTTPPTSAPTTTPTTTPPAG